MPKESPCSSSCIIESYTMRLGFPCNLVRFVGSFRHMALITISVFDLCLHCLRYGYQDNACYVLLSPSC